jgi:hypothetical protein
MHIPAEFLPVLQISLPIILAILGAAWLQNKRLDDIIHRLETIEGILRGQGERLARLEERQPPLVHR